jgi:cystathionine gamma-synthase
LSSLERCTEADTLSTAVESWLILRSLRTLPLRITRQATTAAALAQWLASLTRAAPGSTLDGPSGVIEEVWHGTLQKNASSLIGEGKQMSMGSACFAFTTTKPIYAEWLGHVLKLFVVSLCFSSDVDQ